MFVLQTYCVIVTAVPFSYSTFGERLKAARTGAGLSQVELAEAVGLSRPSLANVERGKQRVLLHQAIALSSVLKIPLLALLDEPKVMDAPGMLDATISAGYANNPRVLSFVHKALALQESK